MTLPSLNLEARGIFRPWIQIHKKFLCMIPFWGHNDETSKYSRISETEKVYEVIMTSFLTKTFEILYDDLL